MIELFQLLNIPVEDYGLYYYLILYQSKSRTITEIGLWIDMIEHYIWMGFYMTFITDKWIALYHTMKGDYHA